MKKDLATPIWCSLVILFLLLARTCVKKEDPYKDLKRSLEHLKTKRPPR